jgi:hypothetical protein
VFNVLFVGYSLAKNNINSTYQYNMISKKNSKTMIYLNINMIPSESFFVPVSVVAIFIHNHFESPNTRFIIESYFRNGVLNNGE